MQKIQRVKCEFASLAKLKLKFTLKVRILTVGKLHIRSSQVRILPE